MANRYANLVGSNKIKDEYTKINTGFDAVQAEMDAVNAELDAHKADTVAHVTQAEHDKLAGIEPGAQVNQNAFSRINDVSATTEEDTVTFQGGTGIIITTDPATKRVIWTATGEATPGPHASSHITGGTDVIPDAVANASSGLMSASDKAKLDAATSAATPNTIVQRDPAGRAKVAAPIDPDDIARKDTIDNAINTHLADYVRQPGYAVASGSANAYSVTLNPAPSAYVDGMAIAVKINVDNTGPSTLNVNSLGAKPIKKPNGNDVAAGNLKAGSVYTLRYNGANFILQGEGGDFSVGDTITDVRLLALSGGMGAEVWSNTDVANGWDVAVDSAGNVYCAHNVSSGGKAIRKLDSSGNEVWSKTDVEFGRGIAVDSAGNVYCAHNVSSGGKAIRKLDSSGNEVWSKTDVANGWDVAVDSAGYVYCAHSVGSGGKAIRKLDSSGNEVWFKTDVAQGRGIAVDSAGNVYCAHNVGSDSKPIRKLDSSGNEIWSKTDVEFGWGIAVDSEGNVYCAHSVGSGNKAIRKLDGNRYFQILG